MYLNEQVLNNLDIKGMHCQILSACIETKMSKSGLLESGRKEQPLI